MFTHEARRRRNPSPGISSLGRSLLAFCGACSIVLAAAVVTPAAADVPSGWEKTPDVTPLHFLLVLFIIPLCLAAVIALLTLLPSLASDRGYEPGQTWRGKAEWFGGPTKGVDSAAAVTPEQIESRSKDTGGTSARW